MEIKEFSTFWTARYITPGLHASISRASHLLYISLAWYNLQSSLLFDSYPASTHHPLNRSDLIKSDQFNEKTTTHPPHIQPLRTASAVTRPTCSWFGFFILLSCFASSFFSPTDMKTCWQIMSRQSCVPCREVLGARDVQRTVHARRTCRLTHQCWEFFGSLLHDRKKLYSALEELSCWLTRVTGCIWAILRFVWQVNQFSWIDQEKKCIGRQESLYAWDSCVVVDMSLSFILTNSGGLRCMQMNSSEIDIRCCE